MRNPPICRPVPKKLKPPRNQQIPSGVPGADPNAIGNRAQSISKDLEVLNTTEDERQSMEVAGQQFESSKLADLQVKSVRVSIMLPTSYYEQLNIKNVTDADPTKDKKDIVLDLATPRRLCVLQRRKNPGHRQSTFAQSSSGSGC